MLHPSDRDGMIKNGSFAVVAVYLQLLTLALVGVLLYRTC
jgi:hypothetical protein